MSTKCKIIGVESWHFLIYTVFKFTIQFLLNLKFPARRDKEDIRLLTGWLSFATHPVFLHPNCMSAIPLHQSHYLSTESHTDINNPPLPPWGLNDAPQLVWWSGLTPDLSLRSQLYIYLHQWKLRPQLPWQLIDLGVQFSFWTVCSTADCVSVCVKKRFAFAGLSLHVYCMNTQHFLIIMQIGC